MLFNGSDLFPVGSRHRAVSLLLANDPKLLDFLLDPARRRLRCSPARLKRLARCFSSGEQILVRAALDLWNDTGRVQLTDIVFRLDRVRLEGFLLAVESLGFPSLPRRVSAAVDGHHGAEPQPTH